MRATDKLLDVQHVTVEFHIGGLVGGSLLVAVNDISFSLDKDRPEIFTLAGESGSGKTTLSRLLLRDLDPTRGKVLSEGRDLATIRKRSEFKEFMKKVQPVFQNPFETVSPLRKVDAYLFDTATSGWHLTAGLPPRLSMMRSGTWDCRWKKGAGAMDKAEAGRSEEGDAGAVALLKFTVKNDRQKRDEQATPKSEEHRSEKVKNHP